MDFNVISPRTKDELLKVIAANQGNNFRFGAGYTDLLPEFENKDTSDLVVVNLAMLQDDSFCSISNESEDLMIGALTNIAEIVNNDYIKENYPVLFEAADSVASRQIRQMATLGGNLCTASPSGDMSCALVALQATCEILDSNGNSRYIPVQNFFTGVKRNALAKNEVLRRIFIPHNKYENVTSGFIKIGKRKSMEIAVLSLAYHFQKDENGCIEIAGLAIGAVAPTIRFTDSACDFLLGKDNLSEEERVEFAQKILAYAKPISDHRASEWYRREVLKNVSMGLFDNEA